MCRVDKVLRGSNKNMVGIHRNMGVVSGNCTERGKTILILRRPNITNKTSTFFDKS